MTQASSTNLISLEVCPNVNADDIGVTPSTLCEYCGMKPAKRKFCSNACRQARYRSKQHDIRICQQCKAKPARQKFCSKECSQEFQKAARLAKRTRWVTAKIRDKSMSFDGRFGGHDVKSVPPLGSFEKLSPEDRFVERIREAFDLPSLFHLEEK